MKRRGRRFPVRGAIAGVIVVLGAAVAAWWLWPEGETRQDAASTKKGLIKEVTPAAAPKAKAEPEAPRKLTREERLFQKTNGYVKAAGQMLTPDGRVLTFPPPKGDEIRIVHSHGKVYQCDSKGNFIDVTPKPVFGNSFEENLLGMASENGAFMPGMLLGHDPGEVTAMLIKKVEISPDDPPDVVEKKEAVAALKKDIIAYIKEGGTFDQYVNEMYRQSVKERNMKREGLKTIAKMLKEGDTEGAAMFRDKFNELAEKQGMRPIRLPDSVSEELGEMPSAVSK